jgi:hypothetical protein
MVFHHSDINRLGCDEDVSGLREVGASLDLL